jgi:molybdate transport system substrate-binding protein
MDYLEERGEIESRTRVELLGNRLVLIAPTEYPEKVKIKPGFNISDLLGDSRLAMGDPDHVPAGIYARQALESLGVWDGLKDKAARSKDVRAALALVERGEARLGVVYSTDARITDKVVVVGLFPEETHPPIRYPAAIIKGRSSSEAKEFMEFLKSDHGARIFGKYGFTSLVP